MEEQRRFDRVTYRESVVLASERGASVLGETRNISTSGMFASGRVIVEPGCAVVVHVHPRGELAAIRLPGIVRRVDAHGIGIQFGELRVREAHVLLRIVAAARARTSRLARMA